MSEQCGLESGYKTERGARRAARALARRLVACVKDQGYSKLTAPPAPRDPGWICDEFADCRILIRWIEPWLPSPYAGLFAVRVDTLVER